MSLKSPLNPLKCPAQRLRFSGFRRVRGSTKFNPLYRTSNSNRKLYFKHTLTSLFFLNPPPSFQSTNPFLRKSVNPAETDISPSAVVLRLKILQTIIRDTLTTASRDACKLSEGERYVIPKGREGGDKRNSADQISCVYLQRFSTDF